MITDIRPVTTLAIAATPIVSDAGPPVVLSQTGPRGATGQAASAEPWGPWDVGQGEIIAEHCSNISRWVGGAMWNPAKDELVWVELWGDGHEMAKGGQVVRRKSQDGGSTARDMLTIFSSETDYVMRAAAFMRLPATGRMIGLLITGANGARKTWAAKSDDVLVNVTWADVTSALGGRENFVYGRMVPLPAVAGGHDTLGAIVTSYGGAEPYIRGLYTGDAGESWASKVLKTTTGLPGAPQEATLVRLPDGRWLLLCRTSGNTNIFGAVAPEDMSAFGPWIDTGVGLGSNVVDAIVDGDYLFMQVFFREGFTAPASGAEDNALVGFKALAADVGDNPAVLATAANRVLLSLIDRGLSYPQSVQRERADGSKAGWYHFFMAGQDPSTSGGAGATLMLARQTPGGIAGPLSPHVARVHGSNPYFQSWPRGTTFGPSTSPLGGPGRWRINPSGGSVLTERVAISERVRAALPFRSAWGVRISIGGGGTENFTGISQRWLNADAIHKGVELADRQRLPVRAYGKGPWQSGLRAFMQANGISLLRTGISTVFPVPQGLVGDAPWVTEVDISTKALSDIGVEPDALTSVDWGIDNNTPATAVDLTLTALLLGEGVMPFQPPLVDPDDLAEDVAKYCERIAVGVRALPNGIARSTSVAWIPLTYSKKVGVPTITVSDPTHFQVRNSADISVTAAAAQSSGEESAILALTVATGALTLGAPYNAATVDAAAWVQIDTGY